MNKKWEFTICTFDGLYENTYHYECPEEYAADIGRGKAFMDEFSAKDTYSTLECVE